MNNKKKTLEMAITKTRQQVGKNKDNNELLELLLMNISIFEIILQEDND